MLNLIAREFNAITPANALKWGPVNPEKNKWQFQVPDQFVDFGMQNNIYVQGHVLVWHSQIPHNLFMDDSGKPAKMSRGKTISRCGTVQTTHCCSIGIINQRKLTLK